MVSNTISLNIYETHLCSGLLDQQDSYKIVFSKVSKLVFWISHQLVLVWTLQWSTCHLRFFTGLLDHMLYLRLRKKILVLRNEQAVLASSSGICWCTVLTAV